MSGSWNAQVPLMDQSMCRSPRIKFLKRYSGLKILVEAKGNYEIRIFGVIEDVEKG